MTDVPGVTPVTIPVDEPTVATPVEPLIQLPPATDSLSVVVSPIQVVSVPVIGVGTAVTVTICVATHAVPIWYDIVAVPVATPVTMPVVEPIVAIPVLLLLHEPPSAPSVSVVVPPMQVIALPPIAGGAVLTVTTIEALQPPMVYNILAVPPATPVTTPVAGLTVAVPVAEELHTPPGVPSVSVVVPPTQVSAVPDIAVTAGLTFTVAVAVDEQVVVALLNVAVYTNVVGVLTVVGCT